MGKLLGRFKDGLPALVAMTILLGVPGCLSYNVATHHFHFASVRLAVALAQSLFMSTVIVGLTCALRGRVARVVQWLFVGVASALLLVELFCFMHFGDRVSTNMIWLALNTRHDEAAQFMGHVFFTLTTLWALVVWVACTVAAVAVGQLALKVSGRVVAVCVIAGNVAGAVLLGGRCFPQVYQLGGLVWHANSVMRIVNEGVFLSEMSEDLKYLEKTLEQIEIERVEDDAPQVVALVIGESFNRHHSSLYGYQLDTNRGLEAEADSGRLAVFTDIVSRYSGTAEVVPELLSTHVYGDPDQRGKYPLLPAVFKAAGYRVSFIDNQSKAVTGDQSTRMMDPPGIAERCFDYRNTAIYQYDECLLPEIDSVASESGRKFLLLRFYGQHVPARLRYPETYGRYAPGDYPDSYEKNQREDLAHYDNATAYNDSLLCRVLGMLKDQDAVVVYVPDHGEEVHDFRNHYGRTLEHLYPEVVRCLYEVPFVVWWSDEYARRRPEKVARIRASVDRPGVNSDAAHLMLDLGGIWETSRCEGRNIISEGYEPYQRVLREEYEY